MRQPINDKIRAERGAEWDDVCSNARGTVTEVPPDEECRDPNTLTNEERSDQAAAGLRAYAQEIGVDTADTTVQDLLADLAHWCDRHGVDLWDCWDSAGRNYHEETNGKGVQFHAK